METIVLVLLALNLLLLVFMYKKSQSPKDESGSQLLQQNLNHLSDNVNKLQDSLRTQIDAKLDKSQASMMQQLSASSKLVQDVTSRLTKLDETNRRVVDVADELNSCRMYYKTQSNEGF